jgi:hypothetical protein
VQVLAQEQVQFSASGVVVANEQTNNTQASLIAQQQSNPQTTL